MEVNFECKGGKKWYRISFCVCDVCQLYLNKTGEKKCLNIITGNSLVVQWLGLHAFTAMGPCSIPGRGTKILQAIWCSLKNRQTKKQVL